MDRTTFLAKLAEFTATEKPGFWYFKDCCGFFQIRNENCECPICYVGRKMGYNKEGYVILGATVAEEIGMEHKLANDVMTAADVSWNPLPLRSEILKACNLTECTIKPNFTS